MSSRHFPARLTLLLGVVALGLVVVPALVFDQPLPWATPDKNKDPAGNSPRQPTSRRFNIKINNFEFAFGKPATPPTAAAAAAPTTPPASPPNPVKPYQIAAVLFALTGLITGPMAWTTARRSRPLVVSGVTLCCCAILWHYVVGGLVVGVAVAILLFILSAFGG